MTNKRYEGFFKSEEDGLEISAMAILPQNGKYIGVIQLVHGMSEYKERYIPFMEYLADHGYAAVIHDHRGHGKSVKNQSDLGFMYGSGARGILKDIETLNNIIHENFPELPVILFGHSMGSLAVRAFTAEHDDKISALIVCGSPSNNPGCSLGKMIAYIEKKILGAHHRSTLLEKISFGPYSSKFKKDPLCSSWLCSDKKIVKEYSKSALCGFTFTDDGYIGLFELMQKAYNWKKWKCTNKELPVLFIAGEDDPCIINIRKFAQALNYVRKAGYVNVKGKVYPKMRHEILNETENQKVFKDVITYLNKQGF